MIEFDGDAAALKRVEEACRTAVTDALTTPADRVDAERRRRAWGIAVPAGLLAAGVAGLAVAPFGWAVLAAAMGVGFLVVAGGGRLIAA